jgi:excisionase family DNA binding protein
MSNFPFVPLSEAAEILGVTQSRVRQMLRANKLLGEKINERAWLVSRKDLIRLAAKRQK